MAHQAAHRTQATETSRGDRSKASPAIFPSAKLDRLTRAHPATPALLFLPVTLMLISMAVTHIGAANAAAYAGAGYLFWSLCEYWGHRAVFHFEPEHGIGARVHWMIHGVHHDHPNDPRRLVLPPAFSIPLAALFYLLFAFVIGTPDAWAVAAGFYVGYVIYDSLHFALHHARPKSRIGRKLRELHMRHHFEDHNRGFGVSAPWWDVVFNTRPARQGSTHRARER